MRKKDRKVFTLGIYDMFHISHLNLLKNSSKYGKLTVGVVTDEGVKKYKGNNRPIINEKNRLEIIKNLKCINWAFLIDDFVIPDFVLKYYDDIVIEENQAYIKNLDDIPLEKKLTLNQCKEISTSDIIQKIKEEK